MAANVERCDMYGTCFMENMGNLKEELVDNGYVDDKIHVCETTITISDNDLESRLTKHEIYTIVDDIKIELIPEVCNDIINDTPKVKEEIGTISDIKIEFDNGLFFCKICEAYYEDYCTKCGMLTHILNRNVPSTIENRDREEMPKYILEIRDSFGQLGIFTLKIIPGGVKLGPFDGANSKENCWRLRGGRFVVNKDSSKYLNWMQYINPARYISEQNLLVFQCEGSLYYQTIREIQAGEELLVYFGVEYEDSFNKDIEMNFIPPAEETKKDVFACTFCCLGFSSRIYLTQHKHICPSKVNEEFSIEELTQCPFCKIYLDEKEYLQHHMAYCCERNVRKCIPLTPDNQTVQSKRSIIRRLQDHRCTQCNNYRTTYRHNLKNHINNEHHKMKMYRCEICYKRFKTRKFLKVHIENKHIDVGIIEIQRYSANGIIKGNRMAGHSSKFTTKNKSMKKERKPLKKNCYMCEMCEFKTKYKACLESHHVKSKHFKQFAYKCDLCQYKTNVKFHLERHLKSKHLKQFDFKCNLCQFRTNGKVNLESHIKSEHLKQFDYKCDLCLYKTNLKTNLERHLKSEHLKQFDFKCNLCQFKTNVKVNLERHVKSDHLKQFDYKCDLCQYKTNVKSNLESHVKSKHLKQFDYKCHLCLYKTNLKHYLESHVKSKHLQQFDYKCDLCQYKTNVKSNLERHLKSEHLKQFDFKCNLCQFKTNVKVHLERHVKSDHLKQFDYKCDLCQYKTNRQCYLGNHVKSKHLKQFDYKCHLCLYKTNQKPNLKRHLKSKHLKQFDYECG